MDFPWLPIGTELGEARTSGQVLRAGLGWQVLVTSDPEAVVLVITPHAQGMPSWWQQEIAKAESVLGMTRLAVGDADYPIYVVSAEEAPNTLDALSLRNPSIGPGELQTIVGALEDARSRHDGAWGSALLLPAHEFLLLTSAGGQESQRSVMVGLMSGGVREERLSPARIRELNPWLTEGEITSALDRLKLSTEGGGAHQRRPLRAPSEFLLPGQPALETQIRDRVLDVLHRPEAYGPLGVQLPNGILLSGPPGAGKSFAARRLAAFLKWPLFELNIAEVGSSLIHETPIRIRGVFQKAAAVAPAVIMLEEVDALARSREMTHSAGVEEVNVLLQEVESASSRGVLVVATTNRKSALDPAFMRRGRFDLVCDLRYPDAPATQAMLNMILAERPCVDGLNTMAAASRLAGRPASDIAAVVEEAARIAAKSGKSAIDDLSLAAALREIAP